ncbi:uncharacterized protein J4E78_004953 [Alternaria triticimaculans]|uniref:uncharacterized protein n=1 Tax=Alternaria triticimaculans TaxID=297637 RepID=UPI0020C3D3B7|nr:uncharacterized protein J4E78_004953 [Alternaria triticimaculans]KAI4660252.1 hypothetical protein J4E78_004953 [Alternaria triticimaculans]
MAMSKYENVIWEDKMKDDIKCTLIALGRAIYGDSLESDCVLVAISYKQRNFAPGPAKYMSALIVYDAPDDNYWRVLMCGESSKSSVGASLEALLEELRELMEAHMSESPTTLTEQGLCTLMLT